ncbi:MAG: DUF4232 domain-containing protein [Streptomyces sp.]|nr:DUF4232 domain-containing protein [Streptomyces sp.]
MEGRPGPRLRQRVLSVPDGTQPRHRPLTRSRPPATATLAPDKSAKARLTISNPDVSRTHPTTPAALLETPPDERDHLTVTLGVPDRAQPWHRP